MATEVVVTRAGDTAVSIIEYEGLAPLSGQPFTRGMCFGVRLTPKAKTSRIIVTLDHIFIRQIEDLAKAQFLTPDALFEYIGAHAIGDYLDEHGSPPFTPAGTEAQVISGDHAAQLYFER